MPAAQASLEQGQHLFARHRHIVLGYQHAVGVGRSEPRAILNPCMVPPWKGCDGCPLIMPLARVIATPNGSIWRQALRLSTRAPAPRGVVLTVFAQDWINLADWGAGREPLIPIQTHPTSCRRLDPPLDP